MDRGLVTKLKNYPALKQREDLESANVEVVYTDKERAVRSLRKGDRLAIATPLHILHTTRNGIELAVERIQKKGCEVWDVTTGETTIGTGVQMYGRATRAISNEKRFGNHKAAGRRGAATRWKGYLPDRKPREEAEKIWKDLSIDTNGEALALMGWTQGMAYNEFGKSGRPTGTRRRKK